MSVINGLTLAPLLDLDFTQGRHYAHRSVVASALTFTRASSGLDYSVQPAVLRATNIPRYMQNSAVNGLNGILIEGADINVVWYNTVYDVLRWTVNGNLTPTDDVTVNLYDGHSFKLVEAAGLGEIYQNVVLTAVKYVIEFLAYTDGSAVTSADVVAFADTATTNEVALTNFEHVGGGVYLCWGVFTATAAAWNVGIEVPAGKTVYVSLLTCHIAAPTSEGGDFPRSPIPNDTGASKTRAADVLTIPADGNIGLVTGTVDVEFTAPCNEVNAATDLRIVEFYSAATNIFLVSFDSVGNTTKIYHRGNSGTARTISVALGFARNALVKMRVVYSTSLLDGTNYMILYSNIGAGWSQVGQTNLQPTAFLAGMTIYVGRYGAGAYSLGSLIRRIRFYGYAKVGLPGDF